MLLFATLMVLAAIGYMLVKDTNQTPRVRPIRVETDEEIRRHQRRRR